MAPAIGNDLCCTQYLGMNASHKRHKVCTLEILVYLSKAFSKTSVSKDPSVPGGQIYTIGFMELVYPLLGYTI